MAAMYGNERRPIHINDGPESFRVKPDRFMNRLRLLQDRGIATDLVVEVEGEDIEVHKVVLLTYLTRFHVVNSSRMRLRGIRAATFRQFLHFCYGDAIRVAPDEVLTMLTASYKLGCAPIRSHLTQRVVAFIEQTPNELLELFLTLSVEGLRQKAHHQILTNIEMVQPQLNALDCQTMITFIVFDLNSDTIDILIASAMSWFRHSPEDRLQHFTCFMSIFSR